MKKLSLSLTAVGLVASLGAYASVPTGAAPFQVVVPNLKSGLEITLEGLYVQPSNSDLDYGVVTNAATVSSTTVTSTNVQTVSPAYNFGFRVGLGYVFPNSGNDVQLAWTYFNHNDTNNNGLLGVSTSGVSNTWTPRGTTSSTSIVAGQTFNAGGTQSFTYNAVDLDVGQFVSIGTRLTTRMFAGLRYAEVKSDLSNGFINVSATSSGFSGSTTEFGEQLNSKFNGIGPRFGVDTSYNVWDCFGVVGHFSAALLIGRVETNTNTATSFISAVSASNTTSATSVNASNSNRVVPAFDAKLGFDYSFPFNNDAQRLSVELGWQATQYVDAVDRLSVDGTRKTSGAGIQGPYLSLNFKM